MSTKFVKYILAVLWLLCFSQFREALISDTKPENFLNQQMISNDHASIDRVDVANFADDAKFDLNKNQPLYFIASASDRDYENGLLFREKMVVACGDRFSIVAVPLESIQVVNWTMPNIKSKLKIEDGEKSFLSGMNQCKYSDSNCFIFCKKMSSLHRLGLEWGIISP